MNTHDTLIVTGSTGFIGSHLIPALKNLGYRLILPVRSIPVTPPDTQTVYWKITDDWENFDDLLQQTSPCGVIHLATRFLPAHSPENIPEIIKANIEFGTRILESATKANIPWFINTGTFWQHFDGADYDPVNLYAATKQAFEVIARYYQNISPIKFVTLCLNDTYGPGDTRKKLFALWKKLSKTPDNRMQMSKGEQLLDILYIDDVINGICHLMKMLTDDSLPERNTRFYLTSDRLLSLQQAAETFAKVSGKKLDICWGARPYRQREVMHPKCSGIKLPGWHPAVTLEEGIKKFLAEGDNE